MAILRPAALAKVTGRLSCTISCHLQTSSAPSCPGTSIENRTIYKLQLYRDMDLQELTLPVQFEPTEPRLTPLQSVSFGRQALYFRPRFCARVVDMAGPLCRQALVLRSQRMVRRSKPPKQRRRAPHSRTARSSKPRGSSPLGEKALRHRKKAAVATINRRSQ